MRRRFTSKQLAKVAGWRYFIVHAQETWGVTIREAGVLRKLQTAGIRRYTEFLGHFRKNFMYQHLHMEEAVQFLRNARMGGIVLPDELRAELRHVQQHPPIGKYAVGASVPNWLVEKLDPNLRLAHRFVTIPTVDRLDRLLLATVQCENVQLRCVMQLSDPLVKAFLRDALEARLFTLLFSIENTRQCAVMSFSIETDDPTPLLDHVQNARRSAAGIAPAMQLTSFSCNPVFVPSLIEGQDVESVVAVLANVPTAEDVENAVNRVQDGKGDRSEATLH